MATKTEIVNRKFLCSLSYDVNDLRTSLPLLSPETRLSVCKMWTVINFPHWTEDLVETFAFTVAQGCPSNWLSDAGIFYRAWHSA